MDVKRSENSTDSFQVEAFTYLGLSVALVAFRVWTRLRDKGARKLYADDYFMMLAMLSYITETVLAYMVGSNFGGLTNSGMTDEERRTLSPDSVEYGWRVAGSKIQVAGWIFYMSVLWAIKASLCCFYSRLTDRVGQYRIRILVGYASIGATYLAMVIIYLFSCHPMHRFWQISPDPGNICQPALSKAYIIATMVLNVVTDIYLIAIPLSMLWGTHLATYKRWSLIFLFSGGVFVMAAALLRGILVLSDPVSGVRAGSAWAVRESFVATVTSNLPVVWGWIKPRIKPLFGSLLSSFSDRRNGGNPGSTSIRLADTKDMSGRWHSRRAHTVTDITACRDVPDGSGKEDGSESSIKELTADHGGIHRDVEVRITRSAADEDDTKSLNKAHKTLGVLP